MQLLKPASHWACLALFTLLFSTATLAQSFDYKSHFNEEISKIDLTLEESDLSDNIRNSLIRRKDILRDIIKMYDEQTALPVSDRIISTNLYESLPTKEEKLAMLERQLEEGLISNANYLAQKAALDQG